MRRQPFSAGAVAWAGIVALAVMASACSGGQRPHLVAAPTSEPLAPLDLDLPAAPASVNPLPPAAADFTLEASVGDALLAWAIDRNVAYLDACDRVTPADGELCDTPTARDTVRLLGPSSDEIWYVVTVDQVTSFDRGTGYRVADVAIAGREPGTS